MGEDAILEICHRLKNNSISLSLVNPWLLGCIEWYKSQNHLVNVEQLYEYVCNQWLLADLHDIQEACLPIIATDVHGKLTGRYSVQVNWIRDVGRSSYSQLKNFKASGESNETLTLENPEKWEPQPTRVYMMEITDGVTTMPAMEYMRIKKLQEPFFPGTKILISGPVECRRGVMLLQENNVTILGGEVVSLLLRNSIENVLARSLNLEEQVNTALQSRSTVTQLNKEEVDLLASDEDEALLLQVSTEALPQSRNTTHILNIPNTSSNSCFINESNNLLDIRENQSVIQKNMNKKIRQSESQINGPSCSSYNTLEDVLPQSRSTNDVEYSLDDDDDYIFATLEDEPQYPFCKEIEGTVQSLTTKLKIRDGEWIATAMITDGKTSFEVQFSPEVLEEIFGLSAAEVQAKRSEMATNPAVKEKINDILKTGQQKLRRMKCCMTIEYASTSELPKVVIVDEMD